MRTFILVMALAVSMGSARAGGLIIVQTNRFGAEAQVLPRTPEFQPRVIPDIRRPGPRFPFAVLEVASEKIDAKIKDQVASVSIEQEFYNPSGQRLEGTFLFPIPKGAHLDQFKMEIGGRMMEPELIAADKARRIYEDIVRAARDPALLEFAGRDLLKVRIFPIEPNSRKKIALSYTQLLKQDAGLLEFTLPIAPQKYSARPVEKLSLNLELETTTALKTVYSPSHNAEISRTGSRRACVKLDERELAADNDFHLLYSFEKSEVAVRVMTHRAAEGDGYFLLFASPGIEANEKAVVAKDVAFVLDTSGSMAGEKIEQARKALLFCVRNLNEADRFEVLRFSTETEGLFHELRPASRENVHRAESFIEGLKPLNGTAIDEALKEALELRSADSERPFVVIFLTDGLPTVGETRVEKIVEHVKGRAQSARVFCFGIGSDVNTHLLDKIAEETRAFSQYVTTGEDIEVKVSSFYSKIRDPLLANIKINVLGDEVRFTKQYPSALPELYKGEQLIVAGRYHGSGKARVRLQGTVNGVKKTFVSSVEFPESESEHDFIPRLWATRRVGALLDQIRLNGENAELRDEVTDLARKYGIVTPYTAYLIMEDEDRRGVPLRAQTIPEAAKMPRLRAEAAKDYKAFREKETGEAAVNATVAAQELRQADRAQSYRYMTTPAPTASRKPLGTAASAMGGRVESKAEFPGQAQQTQQFVAGRSFYQNGNQWVDTKVQTLKGQTPQRIKFNSEPYFALLARYPKLAPVLALGPNLQFVHDGEVIEIYD
jgi:Ca-activated chloride channel family protein